MDDDSALATSMRQQCSFSKRNAMYRAMQIGKKVSHSLQPQNWSFPDSVIYYVTMNPATTKGYQKAIQTCKYFFFKNPVLIFDVLYYNYYGEIGSDDDKVEETFSKYNAKFWITDVLGIKPANFFDPKFASTFITKVYKCDVKKLGLGFQIISLDELKFLASNADEIDLSPAIVKDENGAILSVEKLVEALPNVKKYTFMDQPLHPMYESASVRELFDGNLKAIISSKTMKELLKIEHFTKIDDFCLDGVPESFDVETFYAYMKTNKHTKFNLFFCELISEAYKTRLQTIVDDIIATQQHNYWPPEINFYGADEENQRKMFKILREYGHATHSAIGGGD